MSLGSMAELEPYTADPETLWPTATITVTTSPEWGAGTDANVYLRIIGAHGTTRRMALHAAAMSERARTPFQRGSRDTFRLQIRDVGDVSQIEIGHDGGGPNAAWGLDSVTIACDKGMRLFKADLGQGVKHRCDCRSIVPEIFFYKEAHTVDSTGMACLARATGRRMYSDLFELCAGMATPQPYRFVHGATLQAAPGQAAAVVLKPLRTPPSAQPTTWLIRTCTAKARAAQCDAPVSLALFSNNKAVPVPAMAAKDLSAREVCLRALRGERVVETGAMVLERTKGGNGPPFERGAVDTFEVEVRDAQ